MEDDADLMSADHIKPSSLLHTNQERTFALSNQEVIIAVVSKSLLNEKRVRRMEEKIELIGQVNVELFRLISYFPFLSE